MYAHQLYHRYSPLQKFKTTSDLPPSLNINVFSTRNERVEKLFGTLHEPWFYQVGLLTRFPFTVAYEDCAWILEVRNNSR